MKTRKNTLKRILTRKIKGGISEENKKLEKYRSEFKTYIDELKKNEVSGKRVRKLIDLFTPFYISNADYL